MIDAIAVVAFAVFLCAADQAVEDRKQSDMADVSDRRGDNTLTADDPVMEDQRAADQGTAPEDARPREDRTKQPEETLGSEDPPEQPEETLADQGTAPGEARQPEDRTEQSEEARMSENPPGGRTEQSEDPSGMQDREQGEPVQIPDLSGEYAVILGGITKEAIAGYPVDDSFLMWLYDRYGDTAIRELSALVADGGMNAGCWRDLTGATIHALWMDYCRDTGYQSDLLAQVHWEDGKDAGSITLGFAGDTKEEAWTAIADGFAQEKMPKAGISRELFEIMQQTDVVFLNRESEENGAWTDVRDAESSETDLEYYVVKNRKIGIVRVSLVEDDAGQRAPSEDEGSAAADDVLSRAAALISEASEKSDTVIVMVRWGKDGNLYPDAGQMDAARVFVTAGADAVVGGHAHRLQGVGHISGVPVAYSLGNLRFSDGILYTAYVQITIGEDGGLKVRYIPCIQEEDQTKLLNEKEERDAYYRYVMAISGAAGMDGEGNVYDKREKEIPSGVIVYDSDQSTTGICGMEDVNGTPIDPFGNDRRTS